MTKGDITALINFHPWSGWDNWSLERIQNVVKFRVERLGDLDFLNAYVYILKAEDVRREEKRRKRLWQ